MMRPDGMDVVREVWKILDFITVALLLKCFCQKNFSLIGGLPWPRGLPRPPGHKRFSAKGFFEEVIDGRWGQGKG